MTQVHPKPTPIQSPKHSPWVVTSTNNKIMLERRIVNIDGIYSITTMTCLSLSWSFRLLPHQPESALVFNYYKKPLTLPIFKWQRILHAAFNAGQIVLRFLEKTICLADSVISQVHTVSVFLVFRHKLCMCC